ncbi:MAG: gamma-glutamyl hercynylcysteine S-oxide synthase [Gaiellaceae bacterium]|nr:gamma-glutamyl hercynylcysteine S-oxide synthase [Gaiellaceae bacterium]
MRERGPVAEAVRVDLWLDHESLERALRADVRRGLTATPKELPPKWFYDERGSQLFDEITRLPEYYLTRAERSILEQHAGEIATLSGAETLVELGSGTSEKTRLLLDALVAAGTLSRFVPFDVSEETLRRSAQQIAETYPSLAVHAVVGDFEHHLGRLPRGGRRLVAFLGSTIGNLRPGERARLLATLAAGMEPGDVLLLGADLVKDVNRLEAAYDDAAGVTAAFDKNLLLVLDEALGADFDPERFDHVARFDPDAGWIEMLLRAREAHTVHVRALDLDVPFAAGEELRTEISAKFTRGQLEAELTAAGFELARFWTDEAGDFSLSLAIRGDAESELRHRIRHELEQARARSVALLAPVPDEEQVRQHSPLMSPLVWDLAHIGHFEELWLRRELLGESPSSPEYDQIYDAFKQPRHGRASLPLLGPADARGFVEQIRLHSLDVLDRIAFDDGDPLLRDGFVFGLVAQHEQQHVETMLATLQLREAPYPLADEPAPAPARMLPPEVLVAEGPFLLGNADDPWAYDNERPLHEVELPAFWIDTTPVTNRAFVEFIEAGGYHDPSFWGEMGWSWRCEGSLEHPQFWRLAPDGSWNRFRFGHLEPVPLDEPVQHVCWYEADAYARWTGKRLPTEQEWEKAASWDPVAERKRRFPWGDVAPGPEHANLGGRRFAPAPVGSYPAGASAYGCHQLVGDLWEWTSSDFRGYPGFEPFPYREYSEVFFGSEHKVLRGGSWATHPLVARTTFRNWDFPIRRQIFAGFRCARSA